MKDVRRFVAAVLVGIFVTAGVAAQSRGLTLKSKNGNPIGNFTGSYALVIGESKYANGWSQLSGVQNDARLVTQILQASGFEVVLKMNQSAAELKETYEQFIDQYGLDEGNRLVFYYAGHGHTLPHAAGGDMGYIVPVDAPLPSADKVAFQRKAIEMLQFEAWAKKIQSRHVLFVFDSCFSGSVFNEIRADDNATTFISELTMKPVRQFITAGGPDETVPDESIFRGQFVRALEGQGDTDGDGYITGEELGRYLKKNVVNYTRGRQHPHYAKINDQRFDQGDFVFVGKAKDDSNGTVPPNNGQNASSGSQQNGQQNATAQNPNNAQEVLENGVPQANVPQKKAKPQFLSVKVPDDIRVDVRLLRRDGTEVKSWSDTPSFSEQVEPGEYRLEAQDRAYLYYPFTTSITIADAKVSVTITLKPKFGSLSLRCDPPDGVDVLLNGEKRGTVTNGVLNLDKLKSGSWELVLTRDLYDTKRQSVIVEDGKVTTVSLTLAPNFFTLDVKESGNMPGTVYVDGNPKGSLPLNVKLPFRNIELRVVPNDARYKEWTATVSPRAKGGAETRSFGFAGRKGNLVITTTPDADAVLTLGGANIGTAPLDYEGLIGDYDLTATATIKGAKWVGSARVSIKEDQTATIKLDLKDTTPAAVPERTGNNMVKIPGGIFTMGSPASEPQRDDDEVQHQVTVGTFYLGAYEVTVGEFREFVSATGYKTTAETSGGGYVVEGSSWVQKADANWKKPYLTQTDRDPVVLVSWYDCVEYCNWRSKRDGLKPAYTISGTNVSCDFKASGYRLPTEAEWEYVCRAGTTTPFSTGNNVTTSQANYDGNYPYNGNAKGEYRQKTMPVGSFAPNGYGVYDMHGNVWEWCWDWYGAYATGSQTNPTGAVSGAERVFRGGGWNFSGQILRSANRDDGDPSYRGNLLGFRLARPQF